MAFSPDPNPFAKFTANTTRWNASNALALAQLSDLAYQDATTNTIGQTAAKWGFSQFTVLPVVDDIQVVIGKSQQQVVVAFRGTVVSKDQGTNWPDLSNWMTDLSVLLTPFTTFFEGPEVGQVHKGFAEALFGVWPALAAAVKSY